MEQIEGRTIEFCVYIKPPFTKRIDLYLQQVFVNYSRSTFAKALERGQVLLDGKVAEKHSKVRNWHVLTVNFAPAVPSRILPEDEPLEIIYEEGDFAVVSKDAGVITHPVPGEHGKTGTLVNRLLHHLSSLGGINGVVRPGIVHRLDKDTSGLLLVAKNNRSMAFLQQTIAERKLKKTYIALVCGKFESEEGYIESYIGRSTHDRKKMTTNNPVNPKLAQTRFKVLASANGWSLLEVDLLTGRTHQIRVHFASIGHPILGDSTYGNEKANREIAEKFGLHRQFLHAYSLSLDYMGTPRTFIGPLKADLVRTLKGLDITYDNLLSH